MLIGQSYVWNNLIHSEGRINSKMHHYLFHRCSASWFFSKSFVQNPFPSSSFDIWDISIYFKIFEIQFNFSTYLQLRHHWQGLNRWHSRLLHCRCSFRSHLLSYHSLLLHLNKFQICINFHFSKFKSTCTGFHFHIKSLTCTSCCVISTGSGGGAPVSRGCRLSSLNSSYIPPQPSWQKRFSLKK